MSLGTIAFLGSGETARAGGTLFENLAREVSKPLKIAILETPAGFELNSQQVAERVADFMKSRLQSHAPQIDVVPARKRGTAYSPDDPEILKALLDADLIFMGPGSPTYAVRQLQGSLAWDIVRARQRLGATLVFSSSATIAVGAWCLPVYEIYKVGEDVHSLPGLNLFGDFGPQLSFIPHWNNAEGGDDVDTSRCFVGLARFAAWCNGLPAENTTVGLDEHTWLTLDFGSGLCEVGGVSSVSLVRRSNSTMYPAGARFPITDLGPFSSPEPVDVGISRQAWELVRKTTSLHADRPPQNVVLLAQKRQQARALGQWGESDRLRRQIAALGWVVEDTKDGHRLVKE